MAKDSKEAQEQPEAKKPHAEGETKSTCGCGCVPPIKKK